MQFGTLADRLGNGLQNRVEQFDSARYLFKLSGNSLRNFRFNCIMPPTLTQQYIYKRQTDQIILLKTQQYYLIQTNN